MLGLYTSSGVYITLGLSGASHHTMKKVFLPLLFVWSSSVCFSAPCDRVERSINKSESESVAKVMAAELKSEAAEVFDYMRVGKWRIVWIDTFDSEPGVFFFKGNPTKTKYVAVWGGASGYGEEKQDIEWARSNIPGIPLSLAKCFAWRVSPDGREQAARKRQ